MLLCASPQTPADAAPRASNAECCDEPSEDCSSGRPSTCNAGCARVLVPYFDDCGAALGKAARQFEDVVALCAEVNGMVSAAAGSALATTLRLTRPGVFLLRSLLGMPATPPADEGLGKRLKGLACAGRRRR